MLTRKQIQKQLAHRRGDSLPTNLDNKRKLWRDIPEELRLGTFVWINVDKWEKQLISSATVASAMYLEIEKSMDLHDPFIINIPHTKRPQVSLVADYLETYLQQRRSKYCIDWWHANPGARKSAGLIAIRHIGLAEIALRD